MNKLFNLGSSLLSRTCLPLQALSSNVLTRSFNVSASPFVPCVPKCFGSNLLLNFGNKGNPLNSKSYPNYVPLAENLKSVSSVHSLAYDGTNHVCKTKQSSLQKTSFLSIISIRTNVRNHFPRPSEIKRLRRHGWKKRISTVGGREIIMRRILRGRHCLTH